MYFKDNNKSSKCWFGGEYSFPYYEFSKLQQWLEIGQKIQKIYHLHRELSILLDDVESNHSPILQRKYDKTTGYTSETAKPIRQFVPKGQIKYICRLIEELFNQDIVLIVRVDIRLRELHPFNNLMENLKIYKEDNKVSRENIEKYFDYITLDSLRHNLLELWDEIRKFLDDKTNEIIIPKPTIENREFYSYFLQSRDAYVEGNEEIALAIIRKAIEDILIRFWILHFDEFHKIDLKKKPDLDDLPGFLRQKGILEEQEFREARPFIKYGNAGIHILGETPKEKLIENSRRMINNGINFVNDLSKKYVETMKSKNYCNIRFTKTGFSIGTGDLYDYICKQTPEDTFKKEDIEEFKE
tara:strand:+ start:7380 stop:8447 length:1068 start_codon:yes stop_codon:yes gene_type:complete